MVIRRQTRRRPRSAPRVRGKVPRVRRGMGKWARPHAYKGKFAQNVKRVLMSNAETKFVRDDNIGTLTNFNSRIAAQRDFYRCFPQTTQGNRSNNRIGQRITPLSISCTVNIAFDLGDALSRDIEVHVFFLTLKQQKSVLAASGTLLYNITNGFVLQGTAELLDNGTGGNTPFDGDFLSTTKPVNKDQFTLIRHYKRHLYKGAGTSNNNQVANNERRHTTITCRLPTPQFIYDAQADVLPTNYCPVMAIGYRYLDGSPADTLGGVIQVQASSQMYFKDM